MFRPVKTLFFLGTLLLFSLAAAPPSRGAGGYVPEYARGFTVEASAGGWKIVVRDPRREEQRWTYLLVPREKWRGDRLSGDAAVVPVPLEGAVLLGTAPMAAFEELGALASVKGVGNAGYIYSREFRRRMDEGDVVDVGNDVALDMELLVALAPEALFWYPPLGGMEAVCRRLRRLRIPLVFTAEHLESSPLGRAEWLVFFGFFTGREEEAQTLFRERAARYLQLQKEGARGERRPGVFGGYPFGDTWYMPGGQSFQAQYVKDAHGRYLWDDLPSSGTVPLDFEAVLHRAAGADFWINAKDWPSRKAALKEDVRYRHFRSLREGHTFSVGARSTPKGGSDYYESGVFRPDRILEDLLRILHPELFPERELYYYRPVFSKEMRP